MDIIVKMKFGAHLYGTATSESDSDIRGVFLPSKKEILLGSIPKSRVFSTKTGQSKNDRYDVDEEIYSLHHFIQLACGGQMVAMDMLHAPEGMLIESSSVWRSIVEQRRRFYTKNMTAFIDYVRRQAGKYGIRGSRLACAAKVLGILKGQNPKGRLRDVWNELPRLEFCHEAGADSNGMRLYNVCGKLFQESVPIGHAASILEKFYNEYGQRARLAAENKNIDWKAVSHAIRAALQMREMLTEHTIRFPLKDAPFLLQVKEGKLNYTSEVVPVLESLIDEIEALAKDSPLPEKVDVAFWDDFICETLAKTRFGNS